jgi:hypothetical protein
VRPDVVPALRSVDLVSLTRAKRRGEYGE